MKGTVITPEPVAKNPRGAGRKARGLAGEAAMVEAIARDVQGGDYGSLRKLVRAVFTLRREGT
jgi:hypothetical protein